ncbi:hypothetical protein LB504_009349 [Fusarium proliferatum]|nr:hypothetical protein LB504_009349 [Fusarium proliferatum]
MDPSSLPTFAKSILLHLELSKGKHSTCSSNWPCLIKRYLTNDPTRLVSYFLPQSINHARLRKNSPPPSTPFPFSVRNFEPWQ